MPKEVLIDGVKFVPISEVESASAAAQDQLEELAISFNQMSHDNAVLSSDLSEARGQIAKLESIVLDESRRNTDRANELLEDAKRLLDKLKAISPDTTILSPTDMVQDFLKPGARIWLREGVYHQQLDFAGLDDVVLEAHPMNTSPVLFSGLREADWGWDHAGEGVFAGGWPGYEGLWQHADPASQHNSNLAYPVLCTIGDQPLKWGSNVELNPGEFWISGSPKQQRVIYIKLEPGQSIEDFRFSPSPWLLKGDESTQNIKIKNINFKGCSNTGFTGAVSLPGSGWTLEDVEVSLVNTIGIELGQGGERSNMRSQLLNSTLKNVVAKDCGQMGWWGSARDVLLQNCGHINSNWKNFDFAWHASCKFENTHYCTFMDWFAKDCNGPGLWFDGVELEDGGGNTWNDIINPTIENCVRTGIELELGSSNNTIEGGIIDGILNLPSPDPGTTWRQSTGFMVKRFSDNNKVTGTVVKNCDKAVWVDVEQGATKNNIFTSITTEDIKDMDFFFWPENVDREGNTYNQ